MIARWFGPATLPRTREARAYRRAFEEGELIVLVPSLLFLEVLNVAARQWRWDTRALEELARWLSAASFEVSDAPLDAVARWSGRGLSAYDAAYAALAEGQNVPLVTDDRALARVAKEIARPLAP